jgi:hypothetical protein
VSPRIPFRGYLLDQASIDAFLVAEKLTGWTLPVMQGSWSTGVTASAGTHAGGGAIDVGLRDADGNLRSAWEQTWTVRNMRRAGFRTWRRTPAQGFAYHAHGILAGDPLVSSAAASQLAQWNAGLNGLADHGSDDDPIDVAAGRPAVLPRGAAVPRTMYDAVTVANIPAGALMVAGYVDGRYANLAAMRARFPHALIVPIAVRASTNDGLVLDIETGDATPAEGPGWVTMRRAAGVDPTVYCNTSTWPAVKEAFASAGVAPPHYWVAQYDGNPAIPAGAVAKQYSSPGPFDISSVADHWPGIDKGAVDMALTTTDGDLVAERTLGKAVTEGASATGTARSLDAVVSRLETMARSTSATVAATASDLAAVKAQVQAAIAAIAALETTGITDAQMDALADRLADKLSARLAS